MAQKLNASIPPDLDLAELFTIRFADNIGSLGNDQLAVGPFMLVPGRQSS